MNIIFKGTKIRISNDEKEYFSDKIQNFLKYYPKILTVRMEAGRTTEHHRKGNIFRVELNLDVPRKKVVRVEKYGPDIITAFDTAEKIVKILLKKLKEQ